jgi:hypothetical protein
MGWVSLASALATLLNGVLRHLGRKQLLDAGEAKAAGIANGMVLARLDRVRRARRNASVRGRVRARLGLDVD